MGARGGAAVRPVEEPGSAQRLNEVAGVVTFAVAAFALLSLLSFESGQPRANLGGPIGYGLGSLLMPALGRAAFLLPVYLVGLGWRLLRSGFAELSVVRLAAACVALGGVAVTLGLFNPTAEVTRAGGWFGGFVGTVLREAFGPVGAVIVAAASCVLAFMFSTRWTLQAGTTVVHNRLQALIERMRGVDGEAAPPLAVPERGAATRKRAAAERRGAPIIVLRETPEPGAGPRPARGGPQPTLPFPGDGVYDLPPLSLLDEPKHTTVRIEEEALRKSSEILEAKLANFGIEGRVVAVRPGPVITTFEIEPAPGVKVNRITNLQDDLAMALRAVGVRILAPVPGKAVVGIEVANKDREHVFLAEILESEPFAHSPSRVTLALGKDSAGNPVVADLARMPHLLMAGATGTGKSVSINAMIMSILFKATPQDVRFVLIDLKMLELSLYEDLPHLLVPVVTDPKKAVIVLKNLVEQMDERYRLLKEKGVRHIDSYNRLLEQEAEAGGIIELTELVGDEDGGSAAASPRHERLPKLVVIIDELADLMMTVGRHVEEPITRLAQKARAAGIHLICATQRPSVDVITGLIKANFPARLSFQVTARVDSRTILDAIGAERLLGGGDMLFLPPGQARVQRLHGAYVSEAEIRKVVGYAKQQHGPSYVMELLEGKEDEEGGGDEEEYDDEMYDQAVRLVTESRQASISWVQRRLRIGYNRAARMIERMEREGVVSASEGGRPREVLAQAIED